MSIRHHLRALAPLALLFLAACSDKAQVANTTQQVVDAKNPGVVGAIQNATGTGVTDKEIDAAINASDTIKGMLESRAAEESIKAASARDDSAAAEATIAAAQSRRPNDKAIEAVAFGAALQCGESADVIERRLAKIGDGAAYWSLHASDGPPNNIRTQYDLFRASQEAEHVLQDLNKMNLPMKERLRRQIATAKAMVSIENRVGAIEASADDEAGVKYAQQEAAKYQQMQRELEAKAAGEY